MQCANSFTHSCCAISGSLGLNWFGMPPHSSIEAICTPQDSPIPRQTTQHHTDRLIQTDGQAVRQAGSQEFYSHKLSSGNNRHAAIHATPPVNIRKSIAMSVPKAKDAVVKESGDRKKFSIKTGKEIQTTQQPSTGSA